MFFFVAYVKRWLHDGKGLMASKSVLVVQCFPIASADVSFQTAVVMPELKWGQQEKNYHYFLPNSIIDGVLTLQMLLINLLWRYLSLPGGFINFWLITLKLDLNWYSFLPDMVETVSKSTLTWRTFLFVFFSSIRIFLLTISNSCILSLWDVFISCLDLILMVN